MKTTILRFLTRADGKKPVDPAIPPDIMEVLESCEIMLRSSDEDEAPRALVCLAGSGWRGAWFHSTEETSARLAHRWPELTSAQIRRCTDFLEAKVMRTFRDVFHADAHAKRRNWVMNW